MIKCDNCKAEIMDFEFHNWGYIKILDIIAALDRILGGYEVLSNLLKYKKELEDKVNDLK